MKSKTSLVAVVLILAGALSCVGGVTEKWTVDVATISPHTVNAYHGETISLECLMVYEGRIYKPYPCTAEFLWQTNGMGNAWWKTNATVSAGVAKATFVPEMDPGADTLSFFYKISESDGASFRINGAFNFYASPSGDIHLLPLPVRAIDFAQVTVENADKSPFALKGEVEKVDYKAVTNIAEYVVATNGFLKEHQSLADYRKKSDKVAWGDVTNHDDFAKASDVYTRNQLYTQEQLYTKTETENKLIGYRKTTDKVNWGDVTNHETFAKLSDVYTKTESDNNYVKVNGNSTVNGLIEISGGNQDGLTVSAGGGISVNQQGTAYIGLGYYSYISVDSSLPQISFYTGNGEEDAKRAYLIGDDSRIITSNILKQVLMTPNDVCNIVTNDVAGGEWTKTSFTEGDFKYEIGDISWDSDKWKFYLLVNGTPRSYLNFKEPASKDYNATYLVSANYDALTARRSLHNKLGLAYERDVINTVTQIVDRAVVYGLTNVENTSSVALANGELKRLDLTGSITNIAVTLTFSSDDTLSGDALLRMSCISNSVISSLSVSGYDSGHTVVKGKKDWQTLKAGDHLVMFTKSSVTNGVVEVWCNAQQSEL